MPDYCISFATAAGDVTTIVTSADCLESVIYDTWGERNLQTFPDDCVKLTIERVQESA